MLLMRTSITDKYGRAGLASENNAQVASPFVRDVPNRCAGRAVATRVHHIFFTCPPNAITQSRKTRPASVPREAAGRPPAPPPTGGSDLQPRSPAGAVRAAFG